MYQDETDYKRLFTALFLATLLLLGWQMFVEMPRRQEMAAHQMALAKKREAEQKQLTAMPQPVTREASVDLPRADRLALTPRVSITSPMLHGSIDLKGGRLDDLTLRKYRETVDPNSPEVVLLSPAGGKDGYFIQAGWVAGDKNTRVPDADTVWKADREQLVPGQPVTLSWNNGQGQIFRIRYKLDKDYLFTVSQEVSNQSDTAVTLFPYAYINRTYGDSSMHYGILHEGPLGVMEGTLEEISYETLRDENKITYDNASGWLGITDKYWITTLIPQGTFKATFTHYEKNGHNRYQVDYLGEGQTVAAGSSAEQRLLVFAGAKEIEVIDRYAEGDAEAHVPPIPLFDRAIDFGVLYFLTKPMLLALTFFYDLVGNFGVSILLLTIVVKLLMYPLANKSFHSMAQMRELQPEVMKLRERYKDDAMKMNQEMMALYKREKVNPASGCLPLLLQMPVFFALYKVLYVSLEMRHAPFFGWLQDLSAPDPSNLFTLFGILDWSHPSWLHLGILPMAMCATMVIQMKLQPKPADPVQAKMMSYMPYFFLIFFVNFPAGLVLYWTWSNILSIIQQQYITRQHKRMTAARKAA